MVRGRPVSDAQVRELRRGLAAGLALKRAALRADMDRKTARKYAREGALPAKEQQPRGRTRPPPRAGVCRAPEPMLDREPGLMAKTLLEWLQREWPNEPWAARRRTLE